MSLPSRKRKLDDSTQKFYAVRAGHKPGVYTNWPDCQENITGFRGANYKSFVSEQDAVDFVAGKDVRGPSASSRSQGEKFYGVAVGLVPGVYTNWADAQKQITNIKGPKYKKFPTRQEAEEFVRTGGKASGKAMAANTSVKTTQADTSQPAAKKAKTSADTTSKTNPTKVYTDGSSLNNGKAGALAGVGVYFGIGDPRNISEPLEGPAQTNQRAELTAVLRALEIVPTNSDVLIITDSNYSINCCTVWYVNWGRNGWKTSTGNLVINKDLVEAIRKLIDHRDRKGVSTDFQWIKGHSNDPSNEAVDLLAKNGARASRI